MVASCFLLIFAASISINNVTSFTVLKSSDRVSQSRKLNIKAGDANDFKS